MDTTVTNMWCSCHLTDPFLSNKNPAVGRTKNPVSLLWRSKNFYLSIYVWNFVQNGWS